MSNIDYRKLSVTETYRVSVMSKFTIIIFSYFLSINGGECKRTTEKPNKDGLSLNHVLKR